MSGPVRQPLLLCLHLLLALVLVLQSTTTFALRSTMLPATGGDRATLAAVPGPSLAGARADAAASRPACHAAAEAARAVPVDPAAAAGDCCEADGLCQWACAAVAATPTTEYRLELPPSPAGWLPPPRSATPLWRVAQRLRPPIA